MKKLLVFALFLGLGTSAYAQSPMGGKLETGLNFSYGMPMDKDMKDAVKASPIYGLLGIAQYNYKVDGGEKDDGIGFNLGVGAKYDVAENVFVGLDIRYHFAPKFESKWYDDDDDEGYTIKNKTNHMMIGINAGYRF